MLSSDLFPRAATSEIRRKLLTILVMQRRVQQATVGADTLAAAQLPSNNRWSGPWGDEVDLSFPIILSSNGAIMDGRHRVAKALREGRKEITAVQFEHDPDPDHVGLAAEDLPY